MAYTSFKSSIKTVLGYILLPRKKLNLFSTLFNIKQIFVLHFRVIQLCRIACLYFSENVIKNIENIETSITLFVSKSVKEIVPVIHRNTPVS